MNFPDTELMETCYTDRTLTSVLSLPYTLSKIIIPLQGMKQGFPVTNRIYNYIYKVYWIFVFLLSTEIQIKIFVQGSWQVFSCQWHMNKLKLTKLHKVRNTILGQSTLPTFFTYKTIAE